jgi:transcriptional regulator of heat shock response
MISEAMKKKENKQLTHRIHTRVTGEKYNELNAILKQSRSIKTLSELLRNMLDEREIVIRHYDNSLDEVMEKLSLIHKELQAIGININQVTHRFHIENQPEGMLFHALEVVKLFQQADLKISAIFSVMGQFSERWLPK